MESTDRPLPLLEGEELRRHLEAILMVADEPATVSALADTLGLDEVAVRAALEEMREEYDDEGRGFELREVGGGWRFYSRATYAEAVRQYVAGNHTARLSQAALETLAIIAYRQPISRAKISAIRGVNVDSVVRSLLLRGLIDEGGQSATGASLYVTTAQFLERMGLRSLDELSPLAPHLPKADELDEISLDLEGARNGR